MPLRMEKAIKTIRESIKTKFVTKNLSNLIQIWGVFPSPSRIYLTNKWESFAKKAS